MNEGYGHNQRMDTVKRLVWVGSSKKDLKTMPADVQDTFGHAPHLAQIGQKFAKTKPLHGFGSAAVLEIVEDTGAGPTAPSTQCGLRMRSMYCIAFRKSPRTVSPPRNRTWT
jgi:phage-related protein